MKLIRAYVRNFISGRVLGELRALNAPRMTVISVKDLGDEIPHEKLAVSAELGSTYTTMVKIELICNDDCAERIKDTIIKAARIGHKGDGLIAVSSVEEAINIKTGDRAMK